MKNPKYQLADIEIVNKQLNEKCLKRDCLNFFEDIFFVFFWFLFLSKKVNGTYA